MITRGSILSALIIVAALCIAGFPKVGLGDPEKEKVDTPDVGELGWMAGRWRGELFGGPIEERWDKAVGGLMLGVARLGEARETALYEFMMVEEKDGRPAMFIRHFRHHLKSMDAEPMEFALIESAKRRAVFEHPDKNKSVSRITYERKTKEELTVTLEGQGGGHAQVHKTVLKRAK